MPSNREAAGQSTVSPGLFLSVSGRPLRFYLRPGPTKVQLQPHIKAGGGVVCRTQEPKAILLADPEEMGSMVETDAHRYVSTQYIRDCVERNKQLEMEDYRFTSQQQHNQTRLTRQRLSLAPAGKPSEQTGRLSYTPEEDAAILKFISKRKSEVGGNKVWQEMEKKQLTNHSWQSMRHRYIKHLVHRLVVVEEEEERKDRETKEVPADHLPAQPEAQQDSPPPPPAQKQQKKKKQPQSSAEKAESPSETVLPVAAEQPSPKRARLEAGGAREDDPTPSGARLEGADREDDLATPSGARLKWGAREDDPATPSGARLKGGAREDDPATPSGARLKGGAREDDPATPSGARLKGGAREDDPATPSGARLEGADREDDPATPSGARLKGGAREDDPATPSGARLKGADREDEPATPSGARLEGRAREDDPATPSGARLEGRAREDDPATPSGARLEGRAREDDPATPSGARLEEADREDDPATPSGARLKWGAREDDPATPSGARLEEADREDDPATPSGARLEEGTREDEPTPGEAAAAVVQQGAAQGREKTHRKLGILEMASREFNDSGESDEDTQVLTEASAPLPSAEPLHPAGPSGTETSAPGPTPGPSLQENGLEAQASRDIPPVEAASPGPAASKPAPPDSRAHLFVFESESQEEEPRPVANNGTAASSSPQPISSKDAAVSLSQAQLEEDKQRIRWLMKQTNQDLLTVTKALLKSSGDFSAALLLLLAPCPLLVGTFWNRHDDGLLLSSDPTERQRLQEKYGQEGVAKRLAFLDRPPSSIPP